MARTPARLPNGTRLSDHVTLGVLRAAERKSFTEAAGGVSG
jgi:hypothetical protein